MVVIVVICFRNLFFFLLQKDKKLVPQSHTVFKKLVCGEYEFLPMHTTIYLQQLAMVIKEPPPHSEIVNL